MRLAQSRERERERWPPKAGRCPSSQTGEEESNQKKPVVIHDVKKLTKRDPRSTDTESHSPFHTSLIVPPY